MKEQRNSHKVNVEKVIKYLERCRDNPTLRAVVEGRTTFAGEINAFYGFDGTGKKLKISEENPEKRGQTPDELVRLIDENCRSSIATTHLVYEEVREGVIDRKPDRAFPRSFVSGALSTGVALGANYLLGKLGFNFEEHVSPFIAGGIAVAIPLCSFFLGSLGYAHLSPLAKAEERSQKQYSAAVAGAPITEEDKGTQALGDINYRALIERARQVDNSVPLMREN